MAQPINVASFLPVEFGKDTLPKETTENLQYVLDKVSVKEQVLIDKYRTAFSSQEIIDEFGLTYLTDFVLAAGYTIPQLRGILVILHHYKGTRFGVEMLLNLLGMTGLTGTASLVEWWESPTTPGLVLPPAQRAIPNTYKIHITLASGAVPPVSIYQAFNKMSPQYVLPALDIGTVFKGAVTPFIQAMGRSAALYHATATDSKFPVYFIEAIGKTNTTVVAAAII